MIPIIFILMLRRLQWEISIPFKLADNDMETKPACGIPMVHPDAS